jgi:hypothetical protein
MKRIIATCVLFLSLVIGLGSSRAYDSPGGPHDYSSLTQAVEKNVGIIMHRRFDLEMRRAGGPRQEVIEALLQEAFKRIDPAWGSWLLETCRNRVVDCGAYLVRAAEWSGKVPPHASEKAAYEHQLIRQEAALQAMTGHERKDLFRRILMKGADHEGPIHVDDGDAVMRAYQEGFLDLKPEIATANARHKGHDWGFLDTYRALALAKASNDPVNALLQIVRRGAELESSRKLLPEDAAQRPALADERRAQVTAVIALTELRRINAPGIIAGLQEALKLYAPVKAYVADRDQQQAAGSQEKARERVSPRSYLGTLGWSIAELIGDLGDRDFERTALGGRCLWDQVNEVEIVLVKRQLLKVGQMVTTTDR